jgi:hypothetical protein
MRPCAFVRPLILTAEHSYMPASSSEMLDMCRLPTDEILKERILISSVNGLHHILYHTDFLIH